MAQTARPISDISAGSWTDEGGVDNDGNLYTSLDETSQDGDSSYVSGGDGAGDFEVKLGSMNDPGSSVDHTVYVWAKAVGSGPSERASIALYQGATKIANIAVNQIISRTDYTLYSSTLSSADADAITNYTDLRVRVTENNIGSGEEVRVTQIYMEVPDAASGYTLTIDDVGSYSLSGQPPALTVGRKLAPDTGSYIVGGQEPTLLFTRKLPVDKGEYSVAGQAVSLVAGRKLVPDLGTYSVSGQDAVLAAHHKMALDSGSYVLTGLAADFVFGRTLNVEVGNYTISGQEVSLIVSRKLALDLGAYVFNGQDVTLTYNPVGGYTLTIEDVGNYALEGQDVVLTVSRKLSAESGGYVLTGKNAALSAGRKIALDTGGYVFSGKNITLRVGRKLTLDAAAYVVSGKDVSLSYNPSGAYVLTIEDTGNYVLTGHEVELSRLSEVGRALVREMERRGMEVRDICCDADINLDITVC